jgi:hypothetical protein
MSNRDVVDTDAEVVVKEGEEIVDLGSGTKAAAKPDTKPAPVVEDELPEKYRGKSAQELARMHQEAERLLGKQGSELGELRQITDKYIKAHLENQVKENTPAGGTAQAEEKIDFFADPEKAIEKIIEKHPKIVGTSQHVELMRRQENMRALESKFPKYMETVGSEDFQQWVGASKVRQRLLVEADRNWDLDAAEELLSTYNALKGGSRKPNDEAAKADNRSRDDALKASQTVPSGTMTPSSQVDSSKKIFRRADIIKLMQADPDRYEALQDEIMAAYRENRVR